MDNQNDPNSSNNTGNPLSGATPPEPNLPMTEPSATSLPNPITSGSIPSWPPSPEPIIPATDPTPVMPTWPTDPVQPSPAPIPFDITTAQPIQPQPSEPSAWPAPSAVTDPLAPASEAIVPQNPTSSWAPPVESTPQTNPAPTFTPPLPTLTPDAGSANPSPLNNPWDAPSQTTPVDQNTPATQPSWAGIPVNPAEPQANNAPATPTEVAPTDLSHLINNNQSEPVDSPVPETLVAPSATIISPQAPSLPNEAHKGGIPKWLIGLGAGLLLLVVGASAYFILGIGQPAKTTSLPAETTPKVAEIKTPPPIVAPTAQPTASGSANFGALGSSGGTQPQQATNSSAMETLRQEALRRQQQGI